MKNIKNVLSYWPLIVVAATGLIAWTETKSDLESVVINLNRVEQTHKSEMKALQALLEKEIQSLEKEVLEKEKLSSERITNVADRLSLMIQFMNEEDDGLRSDMMREFNHVWKSLDK